MPNIEVEKYADISKLSVVGIGMRNESGVASKVFRLFADNCISFKQVTTSEISISYTINKKDKEKAVSAICYAFNLYYYNLLKAYIILLSGQLIFCLKKYRSDLMTLFRGSGVALVTPFNNNQVNYNKIEELIDWHIDNGTDAIIICGTTGEASLCRKKRKRSNTLYGGKTAGRVPLSQVPEAITQK